MQETSTRLQLLASTALHKGDRQYQQDQVAVIVHPHAPGCLLGIVADGMGGKSGGRKAANQAIMTSKQIFERYLPFSENIEDCLSSFIKESHLMIKLTAMAFEEEPHSTLAAFVVKPDRSTYVVHVGDSRVYCFKQNTLAFQTSDHSYVQQMVNDGKLTETEAKTHPQSNLLTSCLGTQKDPPVSIHNIGRLEEGDTLLACSDGFWHYFTPDEIGAIVDTLPPREASETMVSKARQRARGNGDNLSVALVRLEATD